jgi:serine protease AprX
MNLLTDDRSSAPTTIDDTAVRDTRAGRVWRGRRPSDTHTYTGTDTDTDTATPRPRGSLLAVVLTGGLIATGAMALAHLDDGPTTDSGPSIAEPTLEPSSGSLFQLVGQVGARDLWQQGITGRGVNVALIDTGVARVDALGAPGKVVAAVDLSDEATDPTSAFVDNFGHGTHLAGIIAGRSSGADPSASADHPEWFLGVAPDAGLVSVKVAGRDGSVTPAGLIGGIDWVVEHRAELGIRVLNLAIGAEGADPQVDAAIAAAVERAWDAGIVVVTAAGNDGAEADGLVAPATDPYVIAVGAVEATDDGFAPAGFTSRGDGVRDPDVAAPGAHIESLRAPGSYADLEHSEGFVDDQRFLASGSSQSAAVVAGVAALLLQDRPELTPDQVKHLLVSTATPVDGGDSSLVGTGVVGAVAAAAADATTDPQTWERASSDATVPAVAGTVIELDPTSSTWTSSTWTSSTWTSSTWTSSTWTSSTWTSSTWTAANWASSTWTSSTWTSSTWTSSTWTSSTWTSSTWTSSTWTSSTWTSSTWTSSTWT